MDDDGYTISKKNLKTTGQLVRADNAVIHFDLSK